jgi:Leucine-rich repeat (LRR) protein
MTIPLKVLKLVQKNQQRRDKVLNLWRQKLTEIPEEVYQLTHLEKLNLYGNKIQVIPESLRQLPQLRCLDIRRNPIQQLADINGLILDYEVFLTQRHHLTPEHIIGLQLNSISDEIMNDLLSLPQLTELSLFDNELSTLPDAITRLTQLTSLDLSSNELKIIPYNILQLTDLKNLNLYDNPIENPPAEIALQGIGALREYFATLDLGAVKKTPQPN